MTLAGMDPLKMTSKLRDRVSHVHLKDIDSQKKHRVISEGTELYTACADGLFCQIGAGEVDFAALRQLLHSFGYDGWCTVEQDCAPDAAISRIDIVRANRAHLESVGF